MIIDTHAHYDDPQYDEDREELLAGFPAQGIGRVILSTSDLPSIAAVPALAARYGHVYCSVGIHPQEAGDAAETDFLAVKEALQREKVVAVGEIGLDYHYDDGPDKELQKLWFRRQIGLAREAGLPVVIHSRDAAKDTVDLLREEKIGETGCDMHCYSYTKETARELLEIGCYLGIGGVVTFKNAKKLKEVVEYAPLERLLLETDAPYLAPVPYRGKRNSSAYLPYVAEEIARIKGIAAERVIEVTENNARKLFPRMM